LSVLLRLLKVADKFSNPKDTHGDHSKIDAVEKLDPTKGKSLRAGSYIGPNEPK
jgi:hypothetical protein